MQDSFCLYETSDLVARKELRDKFHSLNFFCTTYGLLRFIITNSLQRTGVCASATLPLESIKTGFNQLASRLSALTSHLL